MNWSYNLKHWGLTLLLGIILLTFTQGLGAINITDFLESLILFPVWMAASFIFSLPTLFICMAAFYLLNGFKSNNNWTIPILILLTIGGIILTLYLIEGNVDLRILLCYSVAAIVSGLSFKIEKV